MSQIALISIKIKLLSPGNSCHFAAILDYSPLKFNYKNRKVQLGWLLKSTTM